MKARLFLGTLLITWAMLVNAADDVPETVMQTANRFLPGLTSEDVTPSPIPGLYRIRFGSNIVYMSADGRYMVRGDVIDMERGENITEQARNHLRAESVASMGEDTMIVFEPDQEVRGTVTVFTDITCAYCAKFHREVDQLNDNGIRVRYVAFPRRGVPSAVADDMISIWCADDQQQAMTDAKAGQDVEPKSCSNPVQAHYSMGEKVGVRGTPTIVLEDGSLIGGYVPYARLTDAAIQAHTQASR